MSILSKPYFHNEAAAFAHVEAILWANGRVCPHCGTVDNSFALKGVRSKPSKKNPEGVERHGLYKCSDFLKHIFHSEPFGSCIAVDSFFFSPGIQDAHINQYSV